MQRLLGKVPTADKINNYNVGDSTRRSLRNTGGYRFNERNNRTRDNVTAKVDYIISPRNTFTVTLHLEPRHPGPPRSGPHLRRQSLRSTNDDHAKLLVFAWRSNPSRPLTNEVRFGFNSAPAIFLASQDIPAVLRRPARPSPIRSTIFRTQGRNTDTYNFADNATWVHGQAHPAVRFPGAGDAHRAVSTTPASPRTYTLGRHRHPDRPDSRRHQFPGISSTDLSAAN